MKVMTDKNAFVPEEQFAATPASFSGQSRVLEVNTEDRFDGIVLESIKEVERALRIYNGERGSIEESMATTMDFVDNMQKQAGSFGAGLVAMHVATVFKDKDFVGTMVQAIKCSLAETGSYRESYDYDAMGTNFFKTGVEVQQIGDKFLLRIRAAYVGKEPEVALAKKMGKDMGLSSSVIMLSVSVVDDWWFNISLKDILKPVIELSDKDAEHWVRKVMEGDSITLATPANNPIVLINISLGFSQYFYRHTPGGRDQEKTFHEAREGNMVGAAWDGYRDDEYGAEPAGPTLKISFSYPEKNRYRSGVAVDPLRAKMLQEFRDAYAAKFIPA